MPRRRDEIARITNGYSPAMIEQVTSMALTIAHHSGRERFGWDDLVESMTTLESGTAIGIEYVPKRAGRSPIHEAGHAIAGHAFMKDFESTRLSIKRAATRAATTRPARRRSGSPLPERDVRPARLDARRDGGGARLLQRELDRRRRRRDVGDLPHRPDGRRLGDGPAAVPRHPEGRRDRRGGAAARPRALRGNRAADHEPARQRRRPDEPRPGRGRALRPVEAPAGAQIIGQSYVVAHNLAITEPRRRREDRRRR